MVAKDDFPDIKSMDDLLRELGLAHLVGKVDLGKLQDLEHDPETALELTEALLVAEKKIREQNELLQRLTATPLNHGTVIFVREPREALKGYALIVCDGRRIEVGLPKGIAIAAGDLVKISPKTMQIVDVTDIPADGGIAVVQNASNPLLAEVNYNGTNKIVFTGKWAGRVEAGDRVLLDLSATIILSNLGKTDERFLFTEATNVSWNDIGGLAEAKQTLREAIEFPHTYADLFAFYNKEPIKGILLYGPPGCGKTMLAKATATSIIEIHQGKGRETCFLYVRGPEILDKYVGVAEAKIRQLFQMAKAHKKKHGYAAVLFVDEAEAILYKRGTGRSSDIERTIVPAFLAEMDGLEGSGAIVLLATNRQDILDEAVVRDVRIDRKVKVTRPTKVEAPEIFEIYFKKVPLVPDLTLEEAIKVAAEELFSPKRALYEIKVERGGKSETLNFTLGHLTSGGMINRIVEKAASIAFNRDRLSDTKTGITKGDIVKAVDDKLHENLDLGHNDDLDEFTHNFQDDITDIKKLKQATM